MKEKLALLGGDLREITGANALMKAGYEVKTFGLPGDMLANPCSGVDHIKEAVSGAKGVILAVKGVDREGNLYAPFLRDKVKITEDILGESDPGADIYVGVCSEYLKEICKKSRRNLVPVMDLDPVAVPNAVPTAEGALGVAIEKSPYAVAGSHVLVAGFGRVGNATAALFRSVGAKVSLASRNDEEIRKGLALGYDIRRYSGLPRILPRCHVIINTVPALIFNDEVLGYVRKNAIIIDLATSPGGVDFAAAEAKGIPAYLCPGLPGKVAPITAGEILAEGIIALVEGEGN